MFLFWIMPFETCPGRGALGFPVNLIAPEKPHVYGVVFLGAFYISGVGQGTYGLDFGVCQYDIFLLPGKSIGYSGIIFGAKLEGILQPA